MEEYLSSFIWGLVLDFLMIRIGVMCDDGYIMNDRG